jgi:hypothetical protein
MYLYIEVADLCSKHCYLKGTDVLKYSWAFSRVDVELRINVSEIFTAIIRVQVETVLANSFAVKASILTRRRCNLIHSFNGEREQEIIQRYERNKCKEERR